MDETIKVVIEFLKGGGTGISILVAICVFVVKPLIEVIREGIQSAD